MQLVIVESPTKAKTIAKFLGEEFVVKSSFGHIRDLPKSDLGVDTEHDFEPKYIIPTKAKKNVTALKKDAAKADSVLLATDPDREGEAIAWHLREALGLDALVKKKKGFTIGRVVFHEITKSAIEEAIAHPHDLDQNLVNAQQARRILDRLVGYKISPILWKRYYRGLSAGRVQSVAVKLVVDREREIEKFKADEYWTLTALVNSASAPLPIESQLIKIGEDTLEKLSIKNEAEATKIVDDLKDASYVVANVDKKEVTRNPHAPFTTSTLQQDAAKKLHFSSKQTMMFAQQLYEAGYITYMRTDSLNVAEEALAKAKSYITDQYGPTYLEQRRFKTKSKSAQEAHEAVRPTEMTRTPESMKSELSPQQHRVYDLIWRRFMASQMTKAVFDATTIDVVASRSQSDRGSSISQPQNSSAGEIGTKKYTFRANGSTMKFEGYLKVYPTKFEENELPVVKEGETLTLKELKPEQHFTKPPARFNEASIIKILEKEGIGRPSTYAAIISTILARKYVEKDRSRYFHPTEMGILVNDFLAEHFPEIVDMKFTSRMEDELDEIAAGKAQWVPILHTFYGPFEKKLKEKTAEAVKEKEAEVETTDKICDKCGSPMIIKRGRFGKFIACSNFPECKNVLKEEKEKVEPEKTGEKCEKCGIGDMVIRHGRFGKFIACSNYPTCKNTKKIKKEETADDAPAPGEPATEALAETESESETDA